MLLALGPAARPIRRARLLVCISSVFRDHLVRDYRFPRERTVVVPNPVRLERFEVSTAPPREPAVGSGARPHRRAQGHRGRGRAWRGCCSSGAPRCASASSGGPSLWSDYTPLLEDLPPENAEYVGRRGASETARAGGSDVLLAASQYEPFALTVAEALAPACRSSAQRGRGDRRVERSVAAEVAVGQPAAMAAAILADARAHAHRPAGGEGAGSLGGRAAVRPRRGLRGDIARARAPLWQPPREPRGPAMTCGPVRRWCGPCAAAAPRPGDQSCRNSQRRSTVSAR